MIEGNEKVDKTGKKTAINNQMEINSKHCSDCEYKEITRLIIILKTVPTQWNRVKNKSNSAK